MICPSKGKRLSDLGVKAGDWVRLVSYCSMHGAEIQVPPLNTMHLSADEFGGFVGISDTMGEIKPHLDVASCVGSPDLWIRVFRGKGFPQ